jgi:hypothetical protein
MPSRPQTSTSDLTVTPELSRPDGGSASGESLKMMAKMNASTRPSTKTGMETPRLAKIIVPTSMAEFRRYADNSPIGMPTTTAKIIAHSVSSIVVGKRSMSNWVTGRECLIDDPRSPAASWPR